MKVQGTIPENRFPNRVVAEAELKMNTAGNSQSIQDHDSCRSARLHTSNIAVATVAMVSPGDDVGDGGIESEGEDVVFSGTQYKFGGVALWTGEIEDVVVESDLFALFRMSLQRRKTFCVFCVSGGGEDD